MKLLPTYLFFKLFRLFLHFKQYLWGITPRFVQRFIGFLFIEEAVQSVAWVPGQVLINSPPPTSTIFRELVKNCLGFCCFVTIKDLPLGFFWVKNSIGTISPGGVWGGALIIFFTIFWTLDMIRKTEKFIILDFIIFWLFRNLYHIS